MDTNSGTPTTESASTTGAPALSVANGGAPNATNDSKAAPTGAKFLNKAEIMAARDIGHEDIEVPEWGGWVRVQAMTAAQRSAVEAKMLKTQRDGSQTFDAREMRQLFCAMTIIDPNTGQRMFSDAEVAHLGAKSAAATDRVYESATRQARMTKADLDELAGNSLSDLSDDSFGGTGNG